jgi:hypothetical protein
VAQESIEAAVRIREGAYDSENNEFVSKLGSLYPTTPGAINANPTCAESTPHNNRINGLAKKLALHF